MVPLITEAQFQSLEATSDDSGIECGVSSHLIKNKKSQENQHPTVKNLKVYSESTLVLDH